MIGSASRYATSTIVVNSSLAGKDIKVVVPSIQGAYTFTFTYHTCVFGETLPSIASDFYKDPTLWWVIADANPERMLWDILTPGEQIRVPQVGAPL